MAIANNSQGKASAVRRNLLMLLIATLPVFLLLRWANYCNLNSTSDSWQWMGAIAQCKGFLDLSAFGLNDYMGSQEAWGFHWFGWPALRSTLCPWIPFHPTFETYFSTLILYLSALLCTIHVHRRFGLPAAAAVFLAIFLEPDTQLVTALLRSEPLAGLCLAVIGISFFNSTSPRSKIPAKTYLEPILLLGCSAMLTTTQFIGTAALACGTLAAGILSLRSGSNPRLLRASVFCTAGMLTGTITFLLYYFQDPRRWEQLRANMEGQRVSNWGISSSFMSCFSSFYGLVILGVILWMAGLAVFEAYIAWKRRDPVCAGRAAASWIVGGALIASVLACNPSRQHFPSLMPLILLLLAHHGFGKWHGSTRYTRAMSVASILALAFIGLAYAGSKVRNSLRGGVHWLDQQTAILEKYSDARCLYIPVDYWLAAATLRLDNVAIYTFPNVATPTMRRAYARHVWRGAQPGDILIPSVQSPALKDGYFLQEATSSFYGDQALKLGDPIANWDTDYSLRSRVARPWMPQGRLRWTVYRIRDNAAVMNGLLY